jgi:hypothetical protein
MKIPNSRKGSPGHPLRPQTDAASALWLTVAVRTTHWEGRKLSSESLLVDLVNNLKHLAEDQSAVMDKIKTKALTMNQSALRSLAEKFGKVGTRKLFKILLKKSK